MARRVDWDDPFARLALTHAVGMSGEALLALSLAGSLFFKTDPAQGRQKVLLGLLLTMAPFAVVGPLIGPVVDRIRGGHRAVIIGSMVLRAVVAIGMVWAVAVDSWTLFPLAFAMLVLGKTYQVAKAAVVPSVVHSDAELVEANSKLQVLGGIAGVLAAVPGGVLYVLGSTAATTGCAIAFVAAAVVSFRVPSHRLATTPAAEEELAELRSPAVLLASTTMGVLRGVVGFATFLLAFELRGGADLSRVEQLARHVADHANIIPGQLVLPVAQPPKWYFGVVVPVGVLGGLVGAGLAPRLRRLMPEERILLGATAVAALAGLGAALISGLLGYVTLSFGVAFAASAGKQAFDALVQADAPDANRGRSFARFEARFQVVWVLGAVIPVAVSIPVALGGGAVAVMAAATAACYGIGRFPQLGRAVQSSRSGKSGTSNSSSASSGSG